MNSDAAQAPTPENGHEAPGRASATAHWRGAQVEPGGGAQSIATSILKAVGAAAQLRPPRVRWPPGTWASLISRATESMDTLRARGAWGLLMGVVALLAACALVAPVVWNAAVPALRQMMMQFSLELALLASAGLVAILIAGGNSARPAPADRAAEPAPIPRHAARLRAATITAWRTPGVVVVALAIAALAQGLLLTGRVVPGIVLYVAAASIACLKAVATRRAREPELGDLARRYEVPLAVLILGLTAALRFFMVGAYPPGIEADEIKWVSGYYDYYVGETHRWPASMIFDVGPVPFTYMPVFFTLFGGSIGTGRLATATLSVVGAVAFYFLARRALGVPAGLIATLFLGIAIGDIAASRDAHIEAQIKLWVILAPFFAAWAVDRLRSTQQPATARATAASVPGRIRDALAWIGPAPLLCMLSGASLIAGLLVYDVFAPMAVVVGLYLGVCLLVMLVRAPRNWARYVIAGGAFAVPILIGAPRVFRVIYVRSSGSYSHFAEAWGPDHIPDAEHVQLVLSYVGKNLNEFMSSLFIQQRMGDFILNRPGPWENAALLPLLVIGFGWCLGRLTERHNGLILLWAVLAPIPGAIILGWAAYRIAYPMAPALCLLMAMGLWVAFQSLVASSPRSWKPALTAGMVGLLGLAVVVNSHIYFREWPSYDDRMQMRELIDLVAQNVSPTRVLLMAAVGDRPDFVRNNHEMSQFSARGIVGVSQEPELLRQVPYAGLLPSLLLLRGWDMDARVIYESRFDIGTQPREILNMLLSCFPGTSIDELKYTTMYSIPREAIANSRCVVDTTT